MAPWTDPQPLFTRYRVAWLAYQALQPKSPEDAVSYMRAAFEASESPRQAAAEELRLARDAWLEDQDG
jgi:hypothetical protein